MKKQFLLLTAVLTALLLSGCSQTNNKTNDNQNSSSGTVMENVVPNHGNTSQNNGNKDQNTTTDQDRNGETGPGYRMGIGIISRLEKAQNASDTDGSAEIGTVAAAVTVDGDDRIVGCTIDMVENKLTISNTGSIGSPSNTEYSTKKELGDRYGMKAASEIGKEWYEQIRSLEQYVIGKTVDEINKIKTDDHGYAQDSDLTSSVTISISDFQAAITKAVENAY